MDPLKDLILEFMQREGVTEIAAFGGFVFGLLAFFAATANNLAISRLKSEVFGLRIRIPRRR